MTERELITLLLGLGILAYFSLQHRRQAHLAELRLPLLAFAFITLGWVMDVFDNGDMNFMRFVENFFYLCSAITFTVWTRRLKRGESKWIG